MAHRLELSKQISPAAANKDARMRAVPFSLSKMFYGLMPSLSLTKSSFVMASPLSRAAKFES